MDEHWLVVRGGALGDFVVTLPAIEEVRRRAAWLTLACSPRFAPLLRCPADEVVDVRGTDALWLFGAGRLPRAFHGALVTTPGVAATLRGLGVGRVIDAAAPLPPGMSAVRHFWAPLGLAGESPSPRVAIRGSVPGRPFVVAPGAGGEGRRWPEMEAVARLLLAAGEPVVWAPGHEDPVPVGIPALSLDLEGLVRLAASCAAWLGNDTGTTHLAAAAGAPVVAMFGPSDPASWAPPGARVLPFSSTSSDVLNALVYSAEARISRG